jgi:Bax protein
MIKYLSLTGLTFAIAATVLLSACSTIKNSDPVNEQPIAQPVVEESQPQTEQLIKDPVTITTASLNELTAVFDKLDYNRNNCTASNCEIPRITFNGINKKWQETSHQLPVKVKKELFFRLMAPLVLMANEKIKDERTIIKNRALTSAAVKSIALKYRVIDDPQDSLDESLRNKLLQRVDILPPSLALAQAAEESGWATSRFTIEGNAFFGQWDFSGNGMKPRQQRNSLGNYGIARFASPLACVEGYMLNINSNRAYQKLRALRARLRAENKAVSGYQLAATLDNYSERGQAYIDGLRSMISYNKLTPIDQAHLADNQPIHIIIN